MGNRWEMHWNISCREEKIGAEDISSEYLKKNIYRPKFLVKKKKKKNFLFCCYKTNSNEHFCELVSYDCSEFSQLENSEFLPPYLCFIIFNAL